MGADAGKMGLLKKECVWHTGRSKQLGAVIGKSMSIAGAYQLRDQSARRICFDRSFRKGTW